MIRKLEYKYIVSIIYVFILFLDRLDLTITNVAMPTFAKEFHIGVTDTDWIATSFLIALGVAMPLSGWLSEKYGAKKVFIAANILFIFSSFLCALAWDFSSLIFFRVFQGIGGGIIVPVGMSMTYRVFSAKEYPQVANYTLIPTLVAPSIAPALGGVILKYLSWHWIFFLHLPIGITAIFLSIKYLKSDTEKNECVQFDWVGFILLAFCLSSLFYFLSRVGSTGLMNKPTQISGLVSIFSFLLFLLCEMRIKKPLLNLSFFKITLFSQAIILQVILQICYFGAIFLIALYFQFCLGMTPLQSGLSMTGQSIGTICMLFFSGKIFTKFGPKYSLIFGFICIAMTTYSVLLVQNSNQIFLANFLLWSRGLAIGLVNGPLQACAMFDLEKKELAKGSTLFNILRQVGISLGVALSCMILAIQFRVENVSELVRNLNSNTLPAFKFTFLIFSCMACLGALLACRINNKRILAKLRQI